ncbi:MAG TPA: GxxExxY protein [Anaerolineales bacterium]|nr:GxxExxY protein [Anaerolineales bacterium]
MKDEIEAIATDVVDCAVKVHKALGPGLLESAYQQCHAFELRKRGRDVKTEVKLPIVYEGQKIDAGYRIDVLVDDLIVIENKVVESLLSIHQAQLLTYLKLSGCKIGFLLNWNVTLMKNGLRRVVYNLEGQTPYPKK